MPSLITLLALTTAPHAFAPAPGAGIEPQRAHVEHGETQARFLRSAEWLRFATTDGRDWSARFDEATGTPRWMWGRGIPIHQPGMTKDELLGRVEGLLERHGDLLGFESGTLADGVANYNAKFDTWYVEFTPLRDGTPTYRQTISARIKHGNLILLTVRTAPDAPVSGAWTLSAADAVTQAISQGPAPTAIHRQESAVPQLLERLEPSGLSLRRTWMVQTRTQDPPGIWVSFVDAATGELLNAHNEVRFIAGEVTGNHHERSPEQPLITSPMPLVFVEGDVDEDVTNETGDYDVTSSGTYTTDLHGDYLFVSNDAGPDGVLDDDDPDLLWTTADATQAEIDTYVFGNQIRVWGERVEPTVDIVTRPLDAFVNINDVCNAYYDGNINFFAAGGPCNNTGQMADVVYHEWGHGFHAYSVVSGQIDGSVGEGAGDVIAFFQTGDSAMAPFFYQGGGAIRDAGPNHIYPEDLVGEVHEDGLIFSGAMWDTWDLLNADLGDTLGTTTAEAIFVGLLKGGPTIPDTYFEALVADDDDGNLANGTPNKCQILEGFGQHGLGELVGGGTFYTSHEPLTFSPAGLATSVAVEVQSSAPECIVVVPETGNVHWRVNGGPWEEAPATISGQDVTGSIPALSLGSFVEYWMDGLDTESAVWQAPASGDWAPYSFFVGDVIQVTCEDFEASDGGYLHELVDGEPGDGADDWEWGVPVGQAGDPLAAYSGTHVWGNDLGLDGFNGEYQANKTNRVWSPLLDSLWYTDVFLQYRRWLNVEDGYYDQGVITANGSPVWSNHDSNDDAGGEHHQDQQWVSHAVDLRGIADQTTVELGWELHTDGGLEFGGWTIDDVCLYAAANTDNRMAIVDLVVEDQGGPIGLSWTNPIYLPLEEIVVVRRTDAYPTSHLDGELVFRMLAPVAGELVQKVHGNLDGSAGYYAVYGFDGTDWLSWTIEGWNAAHADATSGGTIGGPVTTDAAAQDTGLGGQPGGDEFPDEDGDGKPDEPGGCGCDAAPTGSLAIWPLLGVLALVRRRNRG